MMNVNFAMQADSRKSGTVDLFVDPGLVQLTGARLDVRELVAGAEIDFTERQINVRDVRFNVAGVAGQLVPVKLTIGSINPIRLATALNFSMDGEMCASVELPRYDKADAQHFPRAILMERYNDYCQRCN